MFQAGDIFTVKGENPWISKPIEFIQKWSTPTSTGNETHAGIMISPTLTFESQWRVESNNIYETYGGREMIVGRFKGMTPEKFWRGWDAVKPLTGKKYPILRLVMFLLFPHLTKFFWPSKLLSPFGFCACVCSEVTAKFIKYAEIYGFDQYRGLMPAHLSTRILNYKNIDIILNREKCPMEEP